MSYVAISEQGCGSSEWRAVPEQYESVLNAFKRGDGVMKFTTVDGAEASVRADKIVAIVFMPDTAIAVRQEREARERMEGA